MAGEEINYRRFFDINGLAAIRMEDPEVFRELHRLVLRLVAEGKLTGLRVDHPDGLLAPREYFRQLQEELAVIQARQEHHAQGKPWVPFETIEPRVRERFAQLHELACSDKAIDSPFFRPLYLVAEKILGAGERIPAGWAIHGTTGYDFLIALDGIFVERDSARAMTDSYHRFIGTRFDYGELVYNCKRLITRTSMVSEINVLAHRLNQISELNRRTRDFTLNALRNALTELIAVFPIYRTYIDVDGRVDQRDREYLQWAIAKARRRTQGMDRSIFDFIGDVLMGEERDPMRLEFALKWQQLTGPVMAKGLEDTAFYVYNRLVALNEVGGEPEHFGASVSSFHEKNERRRDAFPYSLLTTSTHDTKRSSDVRARIAVLSEIPDEWKAAMLRWHRWNQRHKTEVGGALAPDRNEEVLFYQSLVGVWPDRPEEAREPSFVERMAGYMSKAVKEAKVNTSWFSSETSYEQAVVAFVEKAMATPQLMDDVQTFVRRLSPSGYQNALSQTLLKLVSPGVPDFYQGSELWERTLVDPDNRRPVDFELRRGYLEGLRVALGDGSPAARARLAEELIASTPDGRIKLYLIWQGLWLRRLFRSLFTVGDYRAPTVEGPAADHLVAVHRQALDETDPSTPAGSLVALAPRLLLRRQARGIGWEGTRVVLAGEAPGQAYSCIYTGQRVELVPDDDGAALEVGPLLERFPVALLVRGPLPAVGSAS